MWHIRGDLHVHASHSACDRHKPGDPVEYEKSCGGLAIAEMREMIKRRKLEYVAIVNHATDPMNPEPPTESSEQKLAQHKRTIRQLNASAQVHSPHLLDGVEASLLSFGDVDVRFQTLCSLSVVIASRHGDSTQWTMEQTISRLERVFATRPVHILGHPTRYIAPQPLHAYGALIELCARYRVAFELNLRNPFGSELVEFIVKSGVLLSLGSDIHPELIPDSNDGSLNTSQIPLISELSAAGLPEDRVVNTWPRKRLEQWLADRRTMCNT